MRFLALGSTYTHNILVDRIPVADAGGVKEVQTPLKSIESVISNVE